MTKATGSESSRQRLGVRQPSGALTTHAQIAKSEKNNAKPQSR
jgi:hypothetical protein